MHTCPDMNQAGGGRHGIKSSRGAPLVFATDQVLNVHNALLAKHRCVALGVTTAILDTTIANMIAYVVVVVLFVANMTSIDLKS
jgi:hypothetical protein